MGMESFRVEIRSTASDQEHRANVVQLLKGCSRDIDQQVMENQLLFIVRGERCITEIEVLPGTNEISCRMTVCHPDSADAEFVGVVMEIAESIGSEELYCPDAVDSVRIMTHPKGDCESLLQNSIQRKRAIWQSLFGTTEGVWTSSEVFEHIIKPHTQSSANMA